MGRSWRVRAPCSVPRFPMFIQGGLRLEIATESSGRGFLTSQTHGHTREPAMPGSNALDRRDFISAAATGIALASATVRARAAVAPAESESAISPQPMPGFDNDENTADILVETLIAWGATHAFGIVGDGINSIIEALRKRSDRIRYIGVRHEEAAAFMASGFAKHTGRLGVCVGTTGPGAIHLLNGLQDAAFDGAPVVALTGLTFHDLSGVRYQQSVDTVRLMQSVALYNRSITKKYRDRSMR
jgi:pyruvate dehydrogenase (quinone)